MAYTKTNINEIKNWLKDNLNEERYIHSIGVMEAAIELAEMFGVDKEKAQTIVSLLYESAIDKTTQGTISVIKNEIKEWLGNGIVSFEVGTYPNIKQCRRKLQG